MRLLKIKHIQQEFILQEGHHYCLTIENPRYYYQVLMDFYQCNEESLFLSRDYQDLDLKKHILLLTNIFAFDINQKKNLTQLYGQIESQYLKPEIQESLNYVSLYFTKILEIIREDLNFSIDYNEIFTLKDCLATVNLTIQEEGTSLLEKLILFIKIQKVFSNYSLVIIPQLDAFLDNQELDLFIKEMDALDITILIINHYFKTHTQITSITIDKDLCEI